MADYEGDDLPVRPHGTAGQDASVAGRGLPMDGSSHSESHDKAGPGIRLGNVAGVQVGTGNVQVNYFFGESARPAGVGGPPGNEGHVVVSYARSDGSEHAIRLQRALQVEGFRTWRDARDIDPASDFTSEIESAIGSSMAVVVCLTPDVGRPDGLVWREIAFAKLSGRPVVVARFANVLLPIPLAGNTCVDFHVAGDAALAHIVHFLRQRGIQAEALPGTTRNTYLTALYREVVHRLDDAILLPLTGRRMRLLEATGIATSRNLRLSGEEILSNHYFRPAYGPIAGAGIRQALDLSRSRLAIVGAPGAGKTIALMALARDLASEAIIDPGRPIPLLVSAASWRGDGSGEAGLTAWLSNEVPMLAGVMADLIRASEAIILVDGLDELPNTFLKKGEKRAREPRKELVRALPRSGPLVIGSRPREFQEVTGGLEINMAFELQPLTDEQVSAFVAEIPGVEPMLRRDDELRAAVRTPLMLSLICSALDAARGKEVGHLTGPEARDLIIGSFVDSRYERECRKWEAASDAPPSLEELRWRLGSVAMSDAGGGGNRNLFSAAEVRAALSPGGYELALNMNIMITARSQALRFSHLSFRDYFAFHNAQIAIRDPCKDVRDSAAWALWQIPDRRVVDLLIGALSDPYPYARGSAASALGRIGDSRAIQPLTKLLADNTPVTSMYGRSIAEVARHAINEIRR